jgi:hypothetical protein
MKDIKLAKWLVVFAVVVTLIVNMVAVLLPLNGITTSEVSDSFKVFFVPANYVFSIWSVIYIGLISFAVYQFKLKEKEYALVNNIFPWFIVASIANSAWLFTWHFGVFYLGLVLMLILLGSLLVIYMKLAKAKTKEAPKQLNYLIKLPISIYLGWISVATIANVTDILALMKWDGFGIPGATWSAFMILIAAILGILMLVKNKDYAYLAVIVWATIGIAAKFPSEGQITAAVILGCAAMVIVAVGHITKDLGLTDKKTKK